MYEPATPQSCRETRNTSKHYRTSDFQIQSIDGRLRKTIKTKKKQQQREKILELQAQHQSGGHENIL